MAALDDAFAESAGVPTVVDAVERSTRMRASRATGWPVTSWFSRLRPDPLKRLHLDLGSSGRELSGRARTSVPPPTKVQRARVDTEVRASPTTWPATWRDPGRTPSARRPSSRVHDLNDRLDAALGATDLGASRIPVWAGLVRVLQWVLLLAALVGAAWLGAIFATRWLTYEMPDTPDVAGYPLPLVVLIGGVVLGILFALVCRLLVRVTARRRARAADRQLRAAIGGVSEELVVRPVRRSWRLRRCSQGHRPGAAVAAGRTSAPSTSPGLVPRASSSALVHRPPRSGTVRRCRRVRSSHGPPEAGDEMRRLRCTRRP